jgi:hypothetical protein
MTLSSRLGIVAFLVSLMQFAPAQSAVYSNAIGSNPIAPKLGEFPPIPDSQIDAHIYRSMAPSERRLMHNIMLHLAPEHRYNVVYYATDGTVHANNPDLIAGTKVYRQQLGQKRTMMISRDGDTIAAPPGHDISPRDYNCASIPVFSGSGPYREVVSTCNSRGDQSVVALQCNDTTFMTFPLYETAYTYLGGFSSYGYAVDAGLQYSQTYQNWALFIRVGTSQVSFPTRLRCNQTASIHFEAASSTLLEATALGYSTTGHYQLFSLVFGVYGYEGWSEACNRCVSKRVTSIGQSPPYNDDFFSGSYFGYDFFNGTGSVAWSYSHVGFLLANGTHIFYPWTAQYTGGYITYPFDPTRMYVYYIDPADETDGIDLHACCK